MAELGDVFGMLDAISRMEKEKQTREHPELELNSIMKRMEREKKSETEGSIAIDKFLSHDPVKNIKLVSDAFRKTESSHARDMILHAYERNTYLREPTKKFKETVCEDLIIGLADKDWNVRAGSANIIGEGGSDIPGFGNVTKGINPELVDRVAKELMASYWRGKPSHDGKLSQAVYGLEGIDYSALSKETRQQVIDFAVKEALEAAGDAKKNVNWWVSSRAATVLNKIGDRDSMDKVNERWLPLLDSKKKSEVDMALQFFANIRCEAAVDKLDELRERGMSKFWFPDIVEKSATRRQEDILIRVVKESGHIPEARIRVLREKGWEKSIEVLNEVIKEPKISKYDIDKAQDAIKEIRKRIASSKISEKAAEKMKEDIDAKGKPKLLKQAA